MGSSTGKSQGFQFQLSSIEPMPTLDQTDVGLVHSSVWTHSMLACTGLPFHCGRKEEKENRRNKEEGKYQFSVVVILSVTLSVVVIPE